MDKLWKRVSDLRIMRKLGMLAGANIILNFGKAGAEIWLADDAVGYETGRGGGGSVTQATSRTTGVTLNALTGAITTNNASLAAEAAAVFVVTNSKVAINDTVVVSQRSGANGGNTAVQVVAVAAGSFSIQVANNNAAAGTAETGAIIINFAVVKGATN